MKKLLAIFLFTSSPLLAGIHLQNGDSITVSSITVGSNGIRFSDNTVLVSTAGLSSGGTGVKDNLGNHIATMTITAPYGINASTGVLTSSLSVSGLLTGTTIQIASGRIILNDTQIRTNASDSGIHVYTSGGGKIGLRNSADTAEVYVTNNGTGNFPEKMLLFASSTTLAGPFTNTLAFENEAHDAWVTFVSSSVIGHSQNYVLPSSTGAVGNVLSIDHINSLGKTALSWKTPSGTSSGIVSPGTFTWTNNYGIGVSTIAASSGTLGGCTFDSTGIGCVGLSNAGEYRMYEASANGSNYISIKATASVTADITYVLTDTGTVGQVLTYESNHDLKFTTRKGGISVSFTNSGSALTSGTTVHVMVPYDATVTGWYAISTSTGSATVDVKKCSGYACSPTASIAGTELPTLSSVWANQDTSLTTWTTSVAENDKLSFVLNSVSSISDLSIVLKVDKR